MWCDSSDVVQHEWLVDHYLLELLHYTLVNLRMAASDSDASAALR